MQTGTVRVTQLIIVDDAEGQQLSGTEAGHVVAGTQVHQVGSSAGKIEARDNVKLAHAADGCGQRARDNLFPAADSQQRRQTSQAAQRQGGRLRSGIS